MAAYPNGQIPSVALATIPDTSRRVRADLLPGITGLRVAFAARFGKALTVTDGYRPIDDQRRIFFDRYVVQATGGGYYGDVRWFEGRRYVRKRGTASASTPGQSNHGWGQAIDFGSGVNTSLTSPEYLWMRANAPRFGWTHPEWARRSAFLEPWHWEGVAVPGLVSNPGAGVGGTVPGVDPTGPILAPRPVTPPEDDMLTLILWCYRELVGREPSREEIVAALRQHSGKTSADVVNFYLYAQAEPASIEKAYGDYLGRNAGPEGHRAWTGQTIEQVRDGVRHSPEAKARG